MDDRWTDSVQVLDAVARIVDTSRPDTLATFSTEVADLAPHDIAAIRTADCARTPVKVVGDHDLTGLVTSAELKQLESLASADGLGSTIVEATLAGQRRSVAVVTVAPGHSRGATLVLALTAPLGPPALAVVEQLWTVASSVAVERAENTGADLIATNRAAAVARAHTVDDVTRTQATILAGLLAVLRSTELDNTQARQRATDMAADALIAVRTAPGDAVELASTPADDAFAAMARELDPITRHGTVPVEFVGPDTTSPLPQDIATTARAATRALLFAATTRTGITRVRVEWSTDGATLHLKIRDDADSSPSEPTAPIDDDIADRIQILGGTCVTDTVNGWGTTVTVEIPLHTTEPAPVGPLGTLTARELEILQAISHGTRNAQIAEHLHLSEHTVKFHVRNILTKLDVSSRVEAAAIARAAL